MGDGSLSQEEIDALLMGADDMAAPSPVATAAATAGGGSALSPSELELLKDAFNEAMQVAGNQAGVMVGKMMTIGNASIEEIPSSNIGNEIPRGSVLANIRMGNTPSAFVFPADLAKKVAAVMMGQDESADVNDAHLSTLSELAQSLLASTSNILGTKFSDSLTPSSPDMRVFNSPADAPAMSSGSTVKITYTISIEGMQSARLIHYIDGAAGQRWAKSQKPASAGGGFDLDFGQPSAPQASMNPAAVNINPVNFPSLQVGSATAALPPNFELLLDVQMVLTVELGRTKKYVKDILSLGEGSIIELDKLAGEPVDLLVNGKLIAKGEVVVIDENFGVRVTDIVGPAERIARMTGG